MDIKEFREKYMGKNSRWDFDKFSIVCNKCGRNRVEFNGFIDAQQGYYNECEIEGGIIVKCHDCGNAFKIDITIDKEFNTNGEERWKKN